MKSLALLCSPLFLVACGVAPEHADDTEDVSPADTDTPSSDPLPPGDEPKLGRAAFLPVESNGIYPNAAFARKTDVYVAGMLEYGDYIEPVDLYFEVTSPDASLPDPSNPVSSDAPECRRFHLAASGHIEALIPAGGCEHQSIAIENGRIIIQLAPYLDGPLFPDANGRKYCIDMYTLDGQPYAYGGGSICFTVAEPVCGNGIVQDGETCDDGNDDNSDGCSTSCKPC